MEQHDTDAIRVLVVDDHEMFVDGVVAALKDEADIEVVGTASTAEAGLASVRALRPTVVLLDEILPDMDGTVVAERILSISPETAIIILTGLFDEAVVARALEAGCSGYVTKDKPMHDVVSAIRSAAAGEVSVSPALLSRLFRKMRGSPTPGRGENLTPREMEVLRLLAQGLSNNAIAEQLGLSRSTVRNHASSILQKLQAHSELEAVLIGMRQGIVEAPRRG